MLNEKLEQDALAAYNLAKLVFEFENEEFPYSLVRDLCYYPFLEEDPLREVFITIEPLLEIMRQADLKYEQSKGIQRKM